MNVLRPDELPASDPTIFVVPVLVGTPSERHTDPMAAWLCVALRRFAWCGLNARRRWHDGHLWRVKSGSRMNNFGLMLTAFVHKLKFIRKIMT